MERPPSGVLSALGAALVFGAATPFSKRLGQGVDPQVFAGLLYLGSGLLLTASLRIWPSGAGEAAVQRRDWKPLLMAVVFNVLWTYARRNRRLIREDFPDAKIRAVTQACAVGVPLSGLVLLLATWTPVGGVMFAFSLSAFYLPGAARFDRS